jgi:ATP-binding protein involved in chromosome partitioning
MALTRDIVLEALSRVIDPELRKPITELDMVREIRVEGGEITVTIALTVSGCPLRQSFQDQVDREVGALEGVSSVTLVFDVMSPDERAALTSKLRGGRPDTKGAIQLDPTTRVIAVVSGKGGVGKSSLTANLAASFAQMGRRVGILDADIYGHSIPHMLGIHQKPVLVDKLMIPPVKHDLKLMSIGFFVDDNAPLMWRGPMLHRALEQFLQDVHWGELDLLFVDMPPGTGDVSISLAQLLPRAEAVVVTTPQLLAQEVASRAAEMARTTKMQLLGVIENMTSEVFGTGGGERLATKLGLRLLGHIPLDAQLRESADEGIPLVISEPNSPTALAISSLARTLDATRSAGFTRTLRVVA